MSKPRFETIEAATAAVADLESKIKTMSEHANTAAATIAELSKKLEEVEGKHQAAIDEVTELSSLLEIQEKNTSGGSIVVVNKKKYSLKGKRFNVPEFGVLSADELSKNKKALEYLVKVKSGVIAEIKEA